QSPAQRWPCAQLGAGRIADLPQVFVAAYHKLAYNKLMKSMPFNSRRQTMFELSDVARAMRTFIDQRAREHAMTRAQWSVPVRLRRQEGMTQAEMAEQLEMQPISLLRLIDRLCQQGLLERRPHPNDRRANLLYLTDRGRATLLRMAPLAIEIAASIFDSVDESEIAMLLAQLRRIKGNIRHAALKYNGSDGAKAVRHDR